MTRYSSYRPQTEQEPTPVKPSRPSAPGPVQVYVPVAAVGAAIAAALMVLLLLTQSQLSQIGFEISALERQLKELESQQAKLRIAHAEAYSLSRIEDYAVNRLGMVRPNPDQIRYLEIDTVDTNRTEPTRGSNP